MKLSCVKLALVFLLAAIALELSGCGETASGIGKDWRRVGKGVKTIFIRDTE